MQPEQKVDKNDLAVRMALLKCYKGRCALSDEPILDDLDIDHIIPISFKKRPTELAEYLGAIKQPEEFELDSLLNLIPVKRRKNIQKSDSLQSVNRTMYLLERASAMVQRVISEIRNFRQLMTVGQAKEVIRGYLHASGIENEPFVEDLYDSLVNDDQLFPEESDFWELDGVSYCTISKSSVRLEGKLPSLKSPRGACRIIFRSLKVRNARINIRHPEIVARLFEGLNTAPEHGLRGFIIDPIRQDRGHVLLGSTRIPLKGSEIQQLCDVIDTFAAEFISSLRRLESQIRSDEFDTSRETLRGYRVARVSRGLWDSMVEFAANHDTDDGKTSWHMFDRNWYYIKVYTRTETARYNDGYHMFFHPEADDQSLGKHEADVWVVAEVLTPNYERESPTVDSRGYWDVSTGHDWLTEEFIPAVVSQYSGVPSTPSLPSLMTRLVDRFTPRRRRKGRRREELLRWESGRRRFCPEPSSIKSSKELREYVEYLQYHLHHPGALYLTTNEVQSLYRAVVVGLEGSSYNDYRYIRAKLPFRIEAESPKEIRALIRQHAEAGQGVVLTYLAVDCTLRCLVVALRDGKSNLGPTQIRDIAIWLSPLYERLMQEQLLERACPDYPEADDWSKKEDPVGSKQSLDDDLTMAATIKDYTRWD